MRFLVAGLLALPLVGCGLAARVESRNDYRASTEQYKACLAENPATPRNCEGLRLAMEADERRFNNLAAGATPGAQTSSSVTILNR